jgi:hypothetical protein
MMRRSKNNASGKNNNAETIEKQYGTRGPGTFARRFQRPLPTAPLADYFLLLADRC